MKTFVCVALLLLSQLADAGFSGGYGGDEHGHGEKLILCLGNIQLCYGKCQLSAAEHSQSSTTQSDKMTASTILNTVDSLTKKEQYSECCICLERKPDVILPCAHSYCLLCIEQWNVNNKTCPICRETLVSTDDTWVLSEVPEAAEISEEIRSSLMKLVDEPPPSPV
ncbi:murashka [Carabus blaptoides fortunei]